MTLMSQNERKLALAKMHRAVRLAKIEVRDDPLYSKLYDYMAKVAEQVSAEAQKCQEEKPDLYYDDFAVDVADLVAKLVIEWNT